MRRRVMQPSDLYLIEEVTDCDLHPDGARVVWSVQRPDAATDSVRSQLWLDDGSDDGSADGSRARPITFGHNEHSPRFSPDGRWLAYLSAAHQAPPQLKILPMAGGEPLILTGFDDGCGEPVWLPDSSGLVLSAPTRPDDERGKSRDELVKRPSARQIESTQYRFNGRGWTYNRRRHLFLVSLPVRSGVATPVARQLTGGPFDDSAPSVSPDGRTVAFVSARHAAREWEGGNDLHTVSIRGGRVRRLSPGGSWQHAEWLADGSGVVALGTTGRGAVRLHAPHVISLDRSVRRLGDGETTAGGAMVSPTRLTVRGSSVFALGVRRGAVDLDRYDLVSGISETVVSGPRVVRCFAIDSSASRIVFAASGPTQPAELFAVVDGVERQLTQHSEPFLRDVEPLPIEEFTTTASDGAPVHGFICRPAQQSRTKRPGLVYVHGGPLAQYSWGFFDEFQLAAAGGYVVVGVNPRGSDGYGQTFAGAILGDLGNLDWVDVQAGADFLAAQPDVEPDRLGIGGGSYGGFMTAWATSHTDRFKAALVERAVINWTTMEATSDIGWFGGVMTGATTVEGGDELRHQSPITYANAVHTPTLVMHSEEDWRCPPEQGEQWFAALRRRGVPTEYVRFPGENHELTRSGRPSFRVQRFGLIHTFFDRYLKPTE